MVHGESLPSCTEYSGGPDLPPLRATVACEPYRRSMGTVNTESQPDERYRCRIMVIWNNYPRSLFTPSANLLTSFINCLNSAVITISRS